MPSDLLLPAEAGRFVSQHATDVSICAEGLKSSAKKIYDCLKQKGLPENRWNFQELNINSSHKQAIDWIFLSDILNFSFWSADPLHKYAVNYGGKSWTGYWAWCAAINRAMDEGIPILDASYYADITVDQLRHVLRSDTDTDIPMFDERLQVLREAGQILVKKYNGSYSNIVKLADQSATKLVQILVEEFPSLRDAALYNQQKVALYKRVQILVGDTWACFNGQGLGAFKDINDITMFADYRIPQALVWFGALKYSDKLMNRLKAGELLENGCEEEVELRAMSIHCVQLIVEEIKLLISKDQDSSTSKDLVNAIMVDHFLWDYRREHDKETDHIPFHRTRCIYY